MVGEYRKLNPFVFEVDDDINDYMGIQYVEKEVATTIIDCIESSVLEIISLIRRYELAEALQRLDELKDKLY